MFMAMLRKGTIPRAFGSNTAERFTRLQKQWERSVTK